MTTTRRAADSSPRSDGAEGAAMRKIIEIPVGDLMSAPALTVKPETTIDELTRLFAEHEFNGLPVVNDLRVLQSAS